MLESFRVYWHPTEPEICLLKIVYIFRKPPKKTAYYKLIKKHQLFNWFLKIYEKSTNHAKKRGLLDENFNMI